LFEAMRAYDASAIDLVASRCATKLRSDEGSTIDSLIQICSSLASLGHRSHLLGGLVSKRLNDPQLSGTQRIRLLLFLAKSDLFNEDFQKGLVDLVQSDVSGFGSDDWNSAYSIAILSAFQAPATIQKVLEQEAIHRFFSTDCAYSWDQLQNAQYTSFCSSSTYLSFKDTFALLASVDERFGYLVGMKPDICDLYFCEFSNSSTKVAIVLFRASDSFRYHSLTSRVSEWDLLTENEDKPHHANPSAPILFGPNARRVQHLKSAGWTVGTVSLEQWRNCKSEEERCRLLETSLSTMQFPNRI